MCTCWIILMCAILTEVDYLSPLFTPRGNPESWTHSRRKMSKTWLLSTCCADILPHADTVTLVFPLETVEETNQGDTWGLLSAVETSDPHRLLKEKKKLPSVFLTSVPPGVGLFPPFTSAFFCHRCALFRRKTLVRCSGATVRLSRVAAWEWMVMRHRLRSQRDAQMLMGLQAEATSREEAWCQHQRLALGSVLAS